MRYARTIGMLIAVSLLASSVACAKRGKGLSKAEKEAMKAHILDDMPSDVPHKVDVNYDDKVHLIGWRADPELAAPGSTVNFTLYWRRTGDLEPGWKLFTHVTTDNTKDAKGNLDCVGAIRQEKGEQCKEQLYGPSEWEKNKVIVDTFSFTVPGDVSWPTYRFLTGVWRSNPDARLQIKNKDTSDEENRANVISLPTGVKQVEPAPQKTELPSLQAPKFGKAMLKIDGKLDEPEWQKAGFTGPFVGPSDGKTPPDHPVSAVARLGWDEANLYVGITVDDKDPTTPFKATDKDPHIWEKSSAVEVLIQPGDPGDNKDYYEIQVDTAGAIFDTHFDDYNAPKDDTKGEFGHMEWASNLKAGVNVEKGKDYTIELAIPWASFVKPRVASPPKPGDVWRINLFSFKDGQKQALGWSPVLGQGNFHKSARFGQVTFVLTAGTPSPAGSLSAAVSASANAPPTPELKLVPRLPQPIKAPVP